MEEKLAVESLESLNAYAEQKKEEIRQLAEGWKTAGFPRSGAIEILDECSGIIGFAYGLINSMSDEAWKGFIDIMMAETAEQQPQANEQPVYYQPSEDEETVSL
jgi:hypothetical protein